MGMFRVSVVVLLTLASPSYAQNLFEFSKTIEAVRLDSLYPLTGNVVPGSIRVFADQDTLSQTQWHFDTLRNLWSLKDTLYFGRTLRIHYLASPSFRFNQVGKTPFIRLPSISDSLRRDRTKRDSLFQMEQLKYQREDFFGDSKIQRQGSISRGIIIGSNRDASLESGLRLDLSGPISEQVYLLATLTDQNIPIQPEGSTQTLREFDKVYLSVKHPKVHLQLGDIDIAVDSSAFTSLNRRLQGGEVSILSALGQQRLTASVARGSYRSQSIDGIEGVQGPYRLNGNQNETFIVVLAGSEKVYLDGIRLSRGEDQDYIIDYSLGEVTFTNRQWITAKSRINIEFQYLNQGYTRSLLSAESGSIGIHGSKWDLWTHVIREADHDHSPEQLNLTVSDIQKLQTAGDDLQKAVISTVVPFQTDVPSESIRYERVDTLVMGQPVRFYRASNQLNGTLFSVTFVRTHDGKGAYTRANSTANGFSYRWVGASSGEYDTLKTLIAPQLKEIVSLKTRYRMNQRSQIYSEWAGSRWDQNRFSPLQDDDNLGIAWKGGIQWEGGAKERPGYKIDLHHQFIGRRFAFLDRSRPVDFDRTWNLSKAGNSNEHITQGQVLWNPLPRTTLRMDLGGLHYSDANSKRIRLGIQSEETDRIQVYYTLHAVDTQQPLPISSGKWIRQQAQTFYSWKYRDWVVTPGMSYQQETRKQVVNSRDSLVSGSLLFHAFTPSIQLRATQKPVNLTWSGEYRVDFQPDRGQFAKESTTLAQNLAFQYEKSPVFSTEHQVGIRHLTPLSSALTNNTAAQTQHLQVRSYLRYRFFDAFLQGFWNYDVRSERKAQLIERYFEVGSELGSYIWEDMNRNGIQELDEFFPERIPGEGNFILQYFPGDRYIPITTLEAGVRHTLQFNAIEPEKIPDFLRRMEVHSFISLKESTTDRQRNILLFRIHTFQGPLTQFGRWSTRHEIQLPVSESKPGFRLSHDFTRSSNQSLIGWDKNKRNTLQASIEYRFSERLFLNLAARSSEYQQISEHLKNRNVNMSAYYLEPELRIVWNPSISSSIGNRWITARDVQQDDKATLNARELLAGTHYDYSKAGRAYVHLSLRRNALNGQTTTYGLYELTEGGADGIVWTGTLSLEHRVSEIIRASFKYDLKSVQSARLLQILRFNVTAIL